MKQCLNCQNDFEYKREAAKFCSDLCRVQYNRKNPKKTTPVSPCMQEMFNSIMAGINAINAKNGQPPAVAAVFTKEPEKEATMSYNAAKEAIEASTSSVQLEDVWRQILKQEWKGWQMNEIKRLKDIQQTKIDF